MWKLSKDIVDLEDYLLNTRTGDIFEVEQSGRVIIEKLERGAPEQFEQNEVTQFMIDNDVIVDSSYDTKQDFFHLQWHLLNECNLRCKHCYDEKEKTDILSFEQMLTVVDNYTLFLRKMEMNGEISLTGGEPLLFQKLPDLIEYIKAGNVYISLYILTNGTIMDSSYIDLFLKYDIGIQISIDGQEEIHDEIRGNGSYQKSIQTIRQLLNAGIDTSVHYVIMKRNEEVIEDFLEEMRVIGIKKIHFSRLVPLGFGEKKMLSPEEMERALTMISRYGRENSIEVVARRPLWVLVGDGGICPVGYKTITIDARGQYLPCRRLPIPLGDVRRESFFKVWFTSSLLQKMRKREEYIAICGTCAKAEECGGCRGVAYAVTGNPFAPDPNCWLNNR